MFMNKFNLALVSAALAVFFLPAAAQAQLSFNIGAVSLYKSNGVDQDGANKDWRPALQGGADYEFGNGFYVGNWNSTGKFLGADLEIDLYGGYRRAMTNGLGYDLSFARYIYPGQDSFNGNEVIFSLSYAQYSAKITRMVSGGSDGSSRFSLGYTRPLTDKLTLKAGLGFRNAAGGNFDDFSLGLTYDLGNALSVSSTLSGASKQAAAGGANDSRLVLGVNKSF